MAAGENDWVATEYLSIEQAAKRVGRSPRTVQRWLSAGMPYRVRAGDTQKWIALPDLQAMFVAKLTASPIRHPSPQRAEHRNRSRYHAGCRCEPCSAAAAAYERGRYQARARAARERRAAALPRV
ncbi:helix-turn-helix domain-containing protein [Rathayibacter sp. AY1C5]|uniref:helix-turn-helix domain-containing protein n=1 Tax=Rathayibacter sp. AY1C5 TaxID=2080538 RepID=UPI0035BE93E9